MNANNVMMYVSIRSSMGLVISSMVMTELMDDMTINAHDHIDSLCLRKYIK